MRGIFMKAIDAAVKRNEELGKQSQSRLEALIY